MYTTIARTAYFLICSRTHPRVDSSIAASSTTTSLTPGLTSLDLDSPTSVHRSTLQGGTAASAARLWTASSFENTSMVSGESAGLLGRSGSRELGGAPGSPPLRGAAICALIPTGFRLKRAWMLKACQPEGRSPGPEIRWGAMFFPRKAHYAKGLGVSVGCSPSDQLLPLATTTATCRR